MSELKKFIVKTLVESIQRDNGNRGEMIGELSDLLSSDDTFESEVISLLDTIRLQQVRVSSVIDLNDVFIHSTSQRVIRYLIVHFWDSLDINKIQTEIKWLCGAKESLHDFQWKIELIDANKATLENIGKN